MKPRFEELFKIFRQYPGLLHRGTGDIAVGSELKSYQGIRQGIIEAGGRAPRKPLHWQIVTQTKRGQI